MGPEGATEQDTKSKLNNIASIAADRKDCMAFGSAHKGNIIAADGSVRSNEIITKNLKSFFSTISSNSYLVLDGNYKYVYDRWNDVYKYIPCNTDVAGLVADTAIRNEPWFSPAGFSRGGIRNLAKLAWNPSKSDRDELYSNRINPIVSFPGQGAVLFEIRQHFQLHLHSTELTSVNSSLFSKEQLRKQQRHNSLNSMMKLPEGYLDLSSNLSSATYNPEEELLIS